MKQDVYTQVTQLILADLEMGTTPWRRPWGAEHAAGPVSRPLRHDGQPYNGINVLMLWLTTMDKGYAAPLWMTYRQAQELGAHVRKGEHGSLVVYASTLNRTETDAATGESVEIEIPYMKGYTVFNVEQIEGLPEHYYARRPAPTLTATQRQARLDAFFAATGADIRHGGNRAFYAIGEDFIQMPPFEAFHSPESYYATLAHEQTHWTRHPSRLNRDMGRKKWGDAGYAMEELVAEIGNAFLCAELGITPEIRDDHAAYIASWLTVLQNDRTAIFTAASHAQKAVDFLLNLQPKPDPELVPEPVPEPGAEPPPTPTNPPTEPPPEPGRNLTPAARSESPPTAVPAALAGTPFNALSRREDPPETPTPPPTETPKTQKGPRKRLVQPGQGQLF